MRFDKELLKGTTEIAILAALAESPCHGYALAQRLRHRSADILELGEGTLYPLLYKLEARGWIEGRWQTGARQRRRKVYRITTRGRRELKSKTQQWESLVRGMSALLKRGCAFG